MKEIEQLNFEDDRCKHALEDLKMIVDGGKKLMRGDFNKLTDKEMVAMYDGLYLGFTNHYGVELPPIGHLTTFGRREVFSDWKEIVRDKLEHFISKTFNF